MALAYTVAGIAGGLEFAAGRGAPLVDAATRLFPDLADQGRTTRPGPVRAAHAAHMRIHLFQKACRNPASMFVGFVDGAVHAERGAAGAATEAGMRHGWGWQNGPERILRRPGPVSDLGSQIFLCRVRGAKQGSTFVHLRMTVNTL